MPRTHLDRKKYKLLDFKIWVEGQMRRNHMTQKELGEVLGLSQPAVCQMLKLPNEKKRGEKINPDPFSYG